MLRTRDSADSFVGMAERHLALGVLVSVVTACMLLAGPGARVAAAPGDDVFAAAQPPGAPDEKSDSKKKRDKGTTSTNSDRDYIKKHLTEYLSPTKVEFLKGGRLRMLFDFSRKDEAHEEIFTPSMQSGFQAQMRWSKEDEDWVVGGVSGIRLSDKGMTLLNCWFEDELEAEIEFAQYITHNTRLVTAVVFCNEKGVSLGSNFGSQCMMFKGRRVAKRGRSKTTSVPFNTTAKIKIVVKDGKFEARRGSSSKAKDTMAYPSRSFTRGRIGIVWGGSTAVTVTRLEITGKVDIAKTAEVLRREFDGA